MSTADNDPQQVPGVVQGDVLAGKYQVEHVLGVGGMGVVVAARHLQLDTMVAIKILLPSMLANVEAVARFGREARAAIQINNEHVARIFDVGTLPTGAPYMVMELLQGIDLQILLEQQGPVAVEEAVDFVLQACEAVAEAHALGIVHRDLKPANLFCVSRADGRRSIKVLDFGISKVTGPMWSPLAEPLTIAAAVMGTPSYMSPEQLEAPFTVDTRTDIWSLGVILYEMLTGKEPFEGSSLPQVSVRIAVRPPRPVRELRSNIPQGLAAVIDTCLEKDRERRYSNVADLATALQPFGSRRARVSVERIIEGTEATAAAAGPPPAAGIRRRVIPVIPGLLALGVTLILGGVLFPRVLRSNRSLRATETTARKNGSGIAGLASAAKIDIRPIPLRLPAVEGASLASALRATPMPSGAQATLAPDPFTPDPVLGGARRQSDHGAGTRSRPRSVSSRASSLVPAGPRSIASESPTAASHCDPPFDLDGEGRKHFKPECWADPAAVANITAHAHVEAGCDPSYDLDEQGRKHFKPECFSNSKR